MDRADFIEDMLKMFPPKEESKSETVKLNFWRAKYRESLPLIGTDYDKLWNILIREYGYKVNPDLKFLLDKLPQCRLFTYSKKQFIDLKIIKSGYPYLYSCNQHEFDQVRKSGEKYEVVKNWYEIESA